MTMKNLILFIYMVSSNTITAQSDNKHETTLEKSNTLVEDRWIWGVAEPITYRNGKVEQNIDTTTLPLRFQLTTIAPVTTTKLENENCKPYNPPTPDFRARNRRISEVKCREYIWKSEVKSKQEERQKSCDMFEKFDDYFLGGLPALPHQFPHMGAVGWKSKKGPWTFKCGSFLISPSFVVTAAHCTRASEAEVDLADPYPKIVRLGHENIDSEYLFEDRRIDVQISSILTYPSYQSPIKYNDIALLKLMKEVEFSKSIAPACLWNLNDTTKLGNVGTVAGWGVLKQDSLNTSTKLQAGQLSIIDSKECDDLLKSFCNRNWCGVDKDQICAGNLTGGVDACQGDSGGPLQVKIPAETEWNFYYVIGVTSFGVGCGQPKIPGVYTKVANFVDWIENIVWPTS